MTEKERMMAGKLYNPGKVGDSTFRQIHQACSKFNNSNFWEDFTALDELCKLFGAAPDDVTLTPPFYCDRGDNIFFGHRFYANTGLTILDTNKVTFGDDVYIGPNVGIYAATHPIDRQVRSSGLEYSKPITIGSDVWIGGHVVINPGVTIGDDVVIGSGSVVTKDIPAHSVAAGNPCKVIRPITEKDHEIWMAQLVDYMNDPD